MRDLRTKRKIAVVSLAGLLTIGLSTSCKSQRSADGTPQIERATGDQTPARAVDSSGIDYDKLRKATEGQQEQKKGSSK